MVATDAARDPWLAGRGPPATPATGRHEYRSTRRVAPARSPDGAGNSAPRQYILAPESRSQCSNATRWHARHSACPSV